MKQENLNKILALHKKWLNREDGGVCANLSSADLSYADLSYADLRYANLSSADLSYADLSYADLRYANLRAANLRAANLSYVVGNSDRIHTLRAPPYQITILDKEIVFGGCTEKTAKEWLAYSDDSLSEKDKHYLETVTKPFIRMVLAM